jgi:hypothetical protein
MFQQLMDFTGWLQSSSLPLLMAASFLITSIAAAAITLLARASLGLCGYRETRPFPMNSAVVTTTSAIFALMIAFSGSGIWNDGNQARAAVQREANALENLRGIAESFPEVLRDRTRKDVKSYAEQVLAVDWPAMIRKEPFTATLYDHSEQILIDLIQAVARESSEAQLANATTAIGQIVEVRSARLQRMALATQGVSPAQWLAMFLIAGAAMFAMAAIHNHARTSQVFAMGVYAVCVSAAFFVVLAHDRPFIGQLSVGAQPIEQILEHIQQ